SRDWSSDVCSSDLWNHLATVPIYLSNMASERSCSDHCPSFRDLRPARPLDRALFPCHFLPGSGEDHMNLAVLRDTGPSPIDDDIARIARTTRCIAIVGLSPNEARPSWGVARYLKSQGYRIVPVNPGHAGSTILDERVYADLRE